MDDASASVAPSLLAVLRDSAARPRPSGPEAHAAALLRGRALARLSHALTAEGLEALLVKGAALALTIYPAAARPMSDIDLLVRRAARAHVLGALTRAGFVAHPPPGRPLSADLLGEVLLTVTCGALPVVVEVHTSLDKIVPRPVCERDLFGRARHLEAPRRAVGAAGAVGAVGAVDLPGLLVPSPEDHALLIALHAAGHEFRHPVAFLDLELLLRAGLDLDLLASRARAWRLQTVMYVAMATLRALGAASVTAAHLALFDPGPLRRAALSRFYDVGSYPVARGPLRLGLRWILRQAPLRDDLAAYARGVARYAALRAADRLVSDSGPRDGQARSSA